MKIHLLVPATLSLIALNCGAVDLSAENLSTIYLEDSDKDANGSLNQDEFIAALREDIPCQEPDCALEFTVADPNGDGQASAQELQNFFQVSLEGIDVSPDSLSAAYLQSGDKDANGSLSQDEFVAALREDIPCQESDCALEFTVADPNGDGQASAQELQNFFQISLEGIDVSPASLSAAYLQSGDKDANGSLSQDEFVAALHEDIPCQESDCALEFTVADPNGDGQASAEELQNFFQISLEGIDVSPASLSAAYLQSGDKDANGSLSQDEFVAALHEDIPCQESDCALEFTVADPNGDGQASAQELQTFFQISLEGIDVSPASLSAAYLQSGDKDANGSLSQDEFVAALREDIPCQESDCALEFTVADPNGDGQASAQELQTFFQISLDGIDVSPDSLSAAYLKGGDKDANGSLNKNEFAEILHEDVPCKASDCALEFSAADKDANGEASNEELKAFLLNSL